MDLQTADTSKSLARLLVNYFRHTPAWMLPLHLIYVMILCMCFVGSYVAAFHFTSLLDVYKEAHNVAEFGNNLRISVETDGKIHDAINDFLANESGMRAYVYRYHNGLAALNGVPFFFQSNIQEVIAPGASRLLPYEQRIPVSINVNIANQFVQDRCVMIPNTESDTSHQNYYFFSSRAARSLVRCPVIMANGDLFGFVGIDFPASKPAIELQQVATKMKSLASKLGTLYSKTSR